MGQDGVFNDAITNGLVPEIQLSWVYGINNKLVSTAVSGSGSISESDNIAICSTGTTAGSESELASIKHIKYHPGQGQVVRFTALLPEASVFGSDVDAYCEIGIGTHEYGMFLGRDLNGVYFNRRYDSVDNKIYYSDWTVNDRFKECYDPTKGNIYEFHYAYLGFGNIGFEVMHPNTTVWVQCAEIKYLSQNTLPNLQNPHPAFLMYAYNGALTTDIQIKNGSVGIFNEGQIKLSASSIISHFERAISSTSTGSLLHIRNRENYNSKLNVLTSYVKAISGFVDGTKNGKISIIKNAVITGASYTDKDTNNSMLEYSTAGTITGGDVLYAINLGKSGASFYSFSQEDNLYISPLETITVQLILVSGSTDVNVDISILEDI